MRQNKLDKWSPEMVGEVYRAFAALNQIEQQAFVDVLPPGMLCKNPTVAALLEVPYPSLAEELEANRKKRIRKGRKAAMQKLGRDVERGYAMLAKGAGMTVAEVKEKLKQRENHGC